MEAIWAIPLVLFGIGLLCVEADCKKLKKRVISLEQELTALKNRDEK